MDLHYHWTREDIAAHVAWITEYKESYWKRLRKTRNILSVCTSAIGVLVLWCGERVGLLLILLAAFLLFGYLPLTHRIVRKNVQKQLDLIPGDILFGERSVLLEEDTLTFQTKEKTTRFPVSEVKDIVETSHAIYLMLRDGTYAMIPNSAFSDHTRSAFISALRQSQQ